MLKNKLMFILDLDYTTIRNDWSIPKNNIKAVKQAKNEGHIVCIVTGRPASSAIMFHKQLELDTFMGVLNGNAIYDPKTEQTKQIAMIDSNPIISYINKIKKLTIPIYFSYQINGEIYTVKETHDTMSNWYQKQAINVGDTIKICPKKIECAFIVIKEGFTKDLMDHFKPYLDSIAIHKWDGLKNDGLLVFEFFSAKQTKGTFVDKLIKHYNIDNKNIYIFGDGTNDLTMFEKSKNTFAVANACQQLKVIASEVLPHDNEEGGVGLKMKKILSKNK